MLLHDFLFGRRSALSQRMAVPSKPPGLCLPTGTGRAAGRSGRAAARSVRRYCCFRVPLALALPSLSVTAFMSCAIFRCYCNLGRVLEEKAFTSASRDSVDAFWNIFTVSLCASTPICSV